MTEQETRTNQAAYTRKQAEEIARKNATQSPGNLATMSPEAIQQTLQELRVHQIELELQNEQLRQRQEELDAADVRFFDFYDLAPVGYVTVSEKGLILEANLTAAKLLGVGRSKLVKQLFSRYILKEDGDLDIFSLHREKLFKNHTPQTWEMQMRTMDGTKFWAQIAALVVESANGAPICRIVMINITERKHLEGKIWKMRNILTEGQKIAHLGTFEYDAESKTTVWSEEEYRIYGIDPAEPSPTYEDMLAKSIYPEDADMLHKTFTNAAQNKSVYELEHRILCSDGSVRWVYNRAHPYVDNHGKLLRYIGATLDITERKQAEDLGKMHPEVLAILNEPEASPDSIHRILAILKSRTGCDAVAIRLQKGEDFPYIAQDGFSAEFLRRENTLISNDADGLMCRDKDGNVRLECTCGLVIAGHNDDSSPFFTPGGSFWTNDSFPLLNIPSHQDPRHNPHNQCMHHGYASFTLVPLRNKDRIIGLIQLNDRRKGYLTLPMVQRLEEIAGHIGAAMVRRWAEDELIKHRNHLEDLVKERTVELKTANISLLAEITERKQVENSLRESEEKYRNLASTVDSLVLVDRNCRHLFANEAYLDRLGLKKELVIGRKFGEFHTVEDSNIFADAVKQVFATGKACTDERLGDNNGRWWFRTYSPVTNKDGAITAVTISYRDITDRKLAEEALQEHQRFLSDLIENSGAVIYVKDVEGRYEIINRKWEEVTGFNREISIGKTDPELFPEAIAKGFRQNDVMVMESGEVLEAEEMLEGTTEGRFFLSIKIPLSDNNGKFRGICGISTDITERKRSRAALVEERRRLQQALDEIRTLRGIVPICAYCKKIRDDAGYWSQVEQYVSKHSEVKFSHGICPECFEREMKELKS